MSVRSQPKLVKLVALKAPSSETHTKTYIYYVLFVDKLNNLCNDFKICCRCLHLSNRELAVSFLNRGFLKFLVIFGFGMGGDYIHLVQSCYTCTMFQEYEDSSNVLG